MSMYADKIFYNGKIYSVDSSFGVFSAMAIKDGKILALAAKEEEPLLIGQYQHVDFTLMEDLNHSVVFPGMSETHTHAPGLAYDILFNVNLYDALTKEETLGLIKNHVDEHPEKDIYYGRGVNSSFFESEESTVGPRKEHLDKISKEKPIIIADFGGNYLWMNSVAFEKYQITSNTPCPNGGEIVRDPKDGSLWGIIRGEARVLVPYQTLSDEQNYQAAKWFQNEMLSNGYTSITALRPPGTVEPRTTIFPIFKALEKRGELFMRVQGCRDMDPNEDIDLQVELMKETKANYNSDFVQFTTAKFFLDGVIEGIDGYLLKPYEKAAGKAPDYRGVFLWDRDKLAYAFKRCMEEGFQIHCHSIGDGATHEALNAMEKAKQQLPSGDYRNVFTHLQLVAPDDIKRMKENSIIANVQAYWHFKSPVMFEQIEKSLLGERAESEYPLQSYFNENIKVTVSSDYPVTPNPNPFHAIEAGVTRNLYNAASFGIADIKHMDDPTYLLNKNERATVLNMIKAFTINAAYARFQEDIIGSLEPGKAADFIVVSEDPFEIDPIDLEFVWVKRTYFGGKMVFCHEFPLIFEKNTEI